MPNSTDLSPDIHERQVAKLNEAINSAHTVTIEFGTGDLPLFESQDVNTYNTGNLYVGVNIDSKQHKFLADRIEAVHGFAILNELLEGEFREIALPSGIADMVFMGNVFGEPDSEFIMEEFKQADGRYKGNSSLETKIQTLQEAKRLLKPEGKLIILENNTPYRNSISRKEPHGRTTALLESNGFAVVETLDQRSEGWNELISHFAKPNDWWSYASYLVIAQKAGK